MFFKKIAVAAAIAGASIGAAVAGPINATGAISNVGVTTVPLGSIGLGTTFSFALSLFSEIGRASCRERVSLNV